MVCKTVLQATSLQTNNRDEGVGVVTEGWEAECMCGLGFDRFTITVIPECVEVVRK